MISKKDILNMARRVTRRSQGYAERKVVHPHREWFIGVTLFIIIAVAGGVFNARNYVYYNTLELRVTDTTTPIKKYKAQTATDALTIYNERLERFNALANTVPVTPVVEEVGTSTATSSSEILEENEVGESGEEEGVGIEETVAEEGDVLDDATTEE